MIVPMKKYSFLVYHREYEEFLLQIQDLGVIHVIEKASGDIENEELNEQYALIKDISNAIKFLEKRDVEKSDTSEKKAGPKVLSELKNVQRTSEDALNKLEILKKEITALEPWGEFSWDNIFRLKKAGLKAKFFSSSAKIFDESDWKERFYLEEISRKDGHVYFILFKRPEDELELDAEQLLLPTRPLSELKKVETEAEKVVAKSEELFDSYASRYIPALQQYKKELNEKLSFDLVKLNTLSEAENKLMIMEGWVPDDKVTDLNTFLDSTGVYYEKLNPEVKEAPPIKLKNNKFARLYEAIGELYTFPNYGEIDLTPFFAPFYMLFFGFCLGDAGYGLLITIGTIYGLFKVQPKFKPLLKLGMYLGIATTFMGIVGGTFFGIMLHPENFEAGRSFAPWITKYQEYILSSDNLMMVALMLGYIQVLFGMFIKAANKAKMYGFKHAISQIGWNVIVMITLPVFALGRMEMIPNDIANKVALITLIIGGVPAMFYNTPGKNPLLNLGTGLWETYQTASGLLGDILSYIRLFALGLSSAILGNVFNTLAIDLSPEKPIILRAIVMVLILAFGHGLNFFMAALGSFVHPLRLTFVEFYKNAGFMGGGKKYEPFSK